MNMRRTFCHATAACALASAADLAIGKSRFAVESLSSQLAYPDGQPATTLRMDATDSGPLLRHGAGPNRWAYLKR